MKHIGHNFLNLLTALSILAFCLSHHPASANRKIDHLLHKSYAEQCLGIDSLRTYIFDNEKTVDVPALLSELIKESAQNSDL